MTKADLIDDVARNSSLSKKDAEVIVQTVLDSIVDSLKTGKKVELRGFGSFRLRDRASREGRNPKTGEKVFVPAKRKVMFKPGKVLKGKLTQPLLEGDCNL